MRSVENILAILLPAQADHTIRGTKLPFYVFAAIAIVDTIRSLIHLLSPNGGGGRGIGGWSGGTIAISWKRWFRSDTGTPNRDATRAKPLGCPYKANQPIGTSAPIRGGGIRLV
ncbi:MAG TPA: hypothetical protein VN924_21810 [Bryobacteraceae bacterium]|nr:hypothetical protein [Bryobacteraceae bacterium]